MAIRWKLKDLNMDEVSFVTAGDNPEAHIVMTKARQRGAVPPMTETFNRFAMSPEDRKAVELAKMADGRPDLRDAIQKASAATRPETPVHPLAKAAADSPAFEELLPYIEEIMRTERVGHEEAIGKAASNPGLWPLVEAYREEQRSLQDD